MWPILSVIHRERLEAEGLVSKGHTLSKMEAQLSLKTYKKFTSPRGDIFRLKSSENVSAKEECKI